MGPLFCVRRRGDWKAVARGNHITSVFVDITPVTFDIIQQVQAAAQDYQRFQKVVRMLAFHPFDSAENALENMNAVSEHELTEDLRVSCDIVELLSK